MGFPLVCGFICYFEYIDSADRALIRIDMLARLFFIALLTGFFAVSAFSQTSRPPALEAR